MRPLQILVQSCETTFRRIDCRHAVAGGGELHGLAARRRAQVEHVACGGAGSAAPGARRRGPAPTSGPRQSRQARRPSELSSADMARRERDPAVLCRIGLGVGIVGKTEVERRPLRDLAARGLNRLVAPRRAPALFDRFGQMRCLDRRHAAAQQGAEHAMDQPPRPAVDQRQCGRDQRHDRACRARFFARAPGAAPSAPSNRRAAGCRVALSISASRSGRRRSDSPAIAIASAWSAAGGRAPASAAASSVCPGATPHRASAARRGARRLRRYRLQRLALVTTGRILGR